jgi:hypothetical protein
MDSDTKAVLLDLCHLCRETLKNTSETRLLALRIHEALMGAEVPGYFEEYEVAEVHFKELDMIKRELEGLTDALLRKARTNLPPK